ncbi:hypothetical protein D3C87_1676400 [compost metagenome]
MIALTNLLVLDGDGAQSHAGLDDTALELVRPAAGAIIEGKGAHDPVVPIADGRGPAGAQAQGLGQAAIVMP